MVICQRLANLIAGESVRRVSPACSVSSVRRGSVADPDHAGLRLLRARIAAKARRTNARFFPAPDGRRQRHTGAA